MSKIGLPTLLEAAKRVKEATEKIRGDEPRRPPKELADALDEAAQEAIIETLKKLGVSAMMVSEEGDIALGSGGSMLIVDPVDGTTNYSRSLQPASTSLAVSEAGTLSDVAAGVVMDLYNGETFAAEVGRGATLDSKPIRTAAPMSLREAMVAVDLSKRPRLDRVGGLLNALEHNRQVGSTALSLCYIAAGRIVAHVDVRGLIRATDVAAALLILKEAGGVYTINGKLFGDLPVHRETRMDIVAASSQPVLNEILGLIG
jgi:fructose-1,6-bisphosphatase/inositol monophosphatase family enzyme